MSTPPPTQLQNTGNLSQAFGPGESLEAKLETHGVIVSDSDNEIKKRQRLASASSLAGAWSGFGEL